MATIKVLCRNSRLTCLAMMSGAVLTILLLFWGFQQQALGALDTRMRAVEVRQSAVLATLDSISKQLDRIEAQVDRIEAQGLRGPAVTAKP